MDFEIFDLYDDFVAELAVGSVGLSLQFESFKRVFTKVVSAFDDELVEEFEALRFSAAPNIEESQEKAPRYSLRDVFER